MFIIMIANDSFPLMLFICALAVSCVSSLALRWRKQTILPQKFILFRYYTTALNVKYPHHLFCNFCLHF